MSEEAPFGAFAPVPAAQVWRRLAGRLPQGYLGRRLASLLLGPAGGRAGLPVDVDVFGSQKARLHPFDNICEKRVFIAPQLWDGAERALLAEAIGAHDDHFFWFADIGANVGLYTLFARAAAEQAGLRLRALCVEADPEMRRRLAFNARASAAEDDIRVFPFAAAGAEGRMRFAVDVASRGLSHLDPHGGLVVEARTILAILAEAGAPRLDAMKIDIEGAEYAALEAFFRDAPEALRPRLLILETSHEAEGRSAKRLALDAGYRERLQTKRNFVGVRN